jgi:hypothetical protein
MFPFLKIGPAGFNEGLDLMVDIFVVAVFPH